MHEMEQYESQMAWHVVTLDILSCFFIPSTLSLSLSVSFDPFLSSLTLFDSYQHIAGHTIHSLPESLPMVVFVALCQSTGKQWIQVKCPLENNYVMCYDMIQHRVL